MGCDDFREEDFLMDEDWNETEAARSQPDHSPDFFSLMLGEE